MERSLELRLYAVLFLALASTGCELVGGIFKAGMWVGVFMVVVVLAVLFFAVSKLRG